MSPTLGTRLRISSYTCTVLYVGPVSNTVGTWLGVEWDDPGRGKHDGVTKDGKRYFTCSSPTSGSFIRAPPSSEEVYGLTFVEALREKYIEAVREEGDGDERVVLGSSNGAIAVQAIGLDKVRSRLSNLTSLREVSLSNVSSAGIEGEIRTTCPNIRGLDLSGSLIPSWDVVALILRQLPMLERLSLNCTRLSLPTSAHIFPSLTELHLNSSLPSSLSSTYTLPIHLMPNLRILELGYNALTHLPLPLPPHDTNVNGMAGVRTGEASMHMHVPPLESLNLDSNALSSWTHICSVVRSYPTLQRLILTSNPLSSIPPYPHASLPSSPIATTTALASPLKSLTHLSLSHTSLTQWSDIDNLRTWCPGVESLWIGGCTLANDPDIGQYTRILAIAKLGGLQVLDGVFISQKERTDAERFYISRLAGYAHVRRDERWDELCMKHGDGQSPPPPPSVQNEPAKRRLDKLSNKLIHLTIHISSTTPPSPFSRNDDDDNDEKMEKTVTLRVLPNTPLRIFRLKLLKALRQHVPSVVPSDQELELWLPMRDNQFARLDEGEEGREIGWWGLEDGADVWAYVHGGGSR